MKILREGVRLTQQQLADRASLDRSRINEIENGKRDPELASAVRIAKALDTTLDYLCGLDSYMGNNWQEEDQRIAVNFRLRKEIMNSLENT